MNRLTFSKFFRHPVAQTACLALIVAAATCGLRRTAWFSAHAELPAYDMVTRLTWPWKAGHPDVVLVCIRVEDKIRSGWPLPDDALAETLTTLLSADPSLVCVDLIRDQEERGKDLSGGTRLREVGLDDRVIWMMGEKTPRLESFDPPKFMMELRKKDPWLRKVASSTFPDDETAGGIVIRRGGVLTWEDDGLIGQYSLPALLSWRHVGGASVEGLERALADLDSLWLSPSAGGYWLPDELSGKMEPLPDFLLKPVKAPASRFRETTVDGLAESGSDDNIPVLALSDVLRRSDDPEALRRAFAGKIVLVGVDDKNLAADEMTVVGDVALRGLKVHALATAQLLRELEGEAPIRYWEDGKEDAVVWAASLLAALALALPRIGQVGRALVVLVAWPALMVAVGALALKEGLWLPIAAPWVAGTATGLGGMVLAWRTSVRERATYLRVMSSHLGPEVTARVLARNDLLIAGMSNPPESFVATAMFGDLRGYSAASQWFDERHQVEEFFTWLNNLLRPAVEITGRHGGFVKQFVGDEIYVVFGFPAESDGGHARRAVECALELAALVPRLNESLPEEQPRYHMRVGIYTGEVHASAVGGGRHADYSFLGPTINKAARLQALRKETFNPEEHPVRILIGDTTRSLLAEPGLAVAFGDGPVELDKRLPPERVWQVFPPDLLQEAGSGASEP
ncbi:CHASE2 domain-containing protein [Luteolibacter arcticus]|uniref:CHASE2 domain-containing protein n=1 Tax=Luteolibacter arcticus TaxID=1581411 RepID=A0ABT3GNU1_9BACT|nr:CHASE2 domain-containing protein [Luteolibacter arcticus]MCW1925195.1 CHASE2 domain-containing protein [Luteolibacter arcticus]